MDGRDHVRRAIRHYLEKDEDLRENPEEQARLISSIKAAFVLARASVAAARDIRDMILRLPPYAEGRPSALHRHYEAVWTFLEALWELIDFCELEQEVASTDVEDPVWFFGRALDQHLGGNPFEALSILAEAGFRPGGDPWVEMLRAEALAATGEQVEAIRAWETAASSDPLLLPAHISVAGELESLGRDREAYAHWQAVQKALGRGDPLAAEAKRHLTRLGLRLQGEPEQTKREPFARLPRWGPSWVPAWPGLGRTPVAQVAEAVSGEEPAAAGVAAAMDAAPGPDTAAPSPDAPGQGSVTGGSPGRVLMPSLPAGVVAAWNALGAKAPFRAGRFQVLFGLSEKQDTDVTVYVAGSDPTSEGVLCSRSAAYLGGGRLVGAGSADPASVEREEPDVVVLASGISTEQCHLLAERARAGTLHSPNGPTVFIYNGSDRLREDLGVIFRELPLVILPDIRPPERDPDAWLELPPDAGQNPDQGAAPAADQGGDAAAAAAFGATVAAVAERARERLGGKPARRSVVARGALGLVPALAWLDGAEHRPAGCIPPFDLIAVSAESGAVETVAVRGEQVAGNTFGPAEDRSRLLEELFDEMPRVLTAGDTALLMGRLLGEGGPVSLGDGPEAFVAAVLAGAVLDRAMLALRLSLAAETSYSVRSSHLVVGGSLLSRLPTPEYALMAAVDGCQPIGVTRLLLDPYGILTALGDGLVSGRLAPDDPSLADGAASLLAGSCVTVAPLVQGINWSKPGRKLVLEATVKGAWRDGDRTWQLYRGEVIWVPLPAGRRVELLVRPAPPHNVGRGRGSEWRGEFVAGGLGLLLDGRGRPLHLPADDSSRTTLRAAWAAEIVGKARAG